MGWGIMRDSPKPVQFGAARELIQLSMMLLPGKR